ncbi:hypothetical protein HOLleu_16181 [Holothuria leucospilota]|uniref:Uncharacterized protein n=1 Tax=Holothuria leucospilota TaxID=206669 RepID=A0A9Q1C3Q2_HOLLE|nr:hypothetical protein HOLleu_16181 [Holothuria leucospilota]
MLTLTDNKMDDFDLSAYSNLGKSKKLPGIGASSSLSGGLSTLAPISKSKTSLVGAPVLSPQPHQSAPKVGRPMTSTARSQGSLSANPSMRSPSSGIASIDSHSPSLGASPSLGRPKLNPLGSKPGSLAQQAGRQGLKRPQNALPGSRAASQGSPGSGGQLQLVINSAEFEKTSTVPWVVNNAGPRKPLSPQRSPDSGRGSVASPFLSPSKSGMAGFIQAPPMASNTGVGETPDVTKQLPSLAPQSLTSSGKPNKGNRKRKNSGQDSISSLIDNLSSSTPTEAPTPPTTNQIVRQHSGRRITKPLPVEQTPPPPPDTPNSWSLSMAPPISPVRSCVSLKSLTSISRESSSTSIGIKASELKPSAPHQNVFPPARYSSPSQKQPKPPVSPDSGVSTPPSSTKWTQPKINTSGSEATLSPRSLWGQNMAGSPPSPFKPGVHPPIDQSQADSLTGSPKLAPIKSADMSGSSLTPIIPSHSPEHETNLMQGKGLNAVTMNGRGFQPTAQNAFDVKMPQQTTNLHRLGSKPVLAPIKKAPFQCAPLKPIDPSTSNTTHEALEMIRVKQIDKTASPQMSNSFQSDTNPALSLSPTLPPPFETPKVSPFSGKAVLAPINKAPFLQSPLGPIGSPTPASEETQPKHSMEIVCGTTGQEKKTASSPVDRSQKSVTSQKRGPSQPSQQVSGTTPSHSFPIGRRQQTSDFWDSSSEDISEQEELIQDTRQESAADLTDHSNFLNKDMPSNHSGTSSSGRLSLASKKLIIVKRHTPNGNGSETKAEFATIDTERMKCNNLAIDDLVPPSCYGRKSLRDLQRSCKEVSKTPVKPPSESSDDESSKSFVFESPSTHHSYHTSDEDPDTSDLDVAIEEDEHRHLLVARDPEARLEEYRRKFNIGTKKETFACQAEDKVSQDEKQSTPDQAEMSKRDLYAAMIATIAREIDEADAAAAEQRLTLQPSRGEPEHKMSHKLTDVSVRDNINHEDQDFTKLTSSCLAESNKVDENKVVQKASKETDGPTQEVCNQKLPSLDANKETISQTTSMESPKSQGKEQQSILTKPKDVQHSVPEKEHDVKTLRQKSESIPTGAYYADIPESKATSTENFQAASETQFTRSRNDDCQSIQAKSDGIPEETDESIPEENNKKISESYDINKGSLQAAPQSITSGSKDDYDDEHQGIQTKSDSILEETEELISVEMTDVKIPQVNEVKMGSSQAASRSLFSTNDDDRFSIQTKSDSIPEEIEESIPEEVNDEVIPEPNDINKESPQATSKPIFVGNKNDDDRFSTQTKSDSIPEEMEESIPEEARDEVIPKPHDTNMGTAKVPSKATMANSRKGDDLQGIQTKSESIPEETEESILKVVNDEKITDGEILKQQAHQHKASTITSEKVSHKNDDEDHHSSQTKSESIADENEESSPDETQKKDIPEQYDTNKGSHAASKKVFHSSKNEDDQQSIQTKSESIQEDIEESIPEDSNNDRVPEPQSTIRPGVGGTTKEIIQKKGNDDDHHSVKTKSESIPEEIEDYFADEFSESGNSIRSSSVTSHGSRHQQDYSRSQDASAETDEIISEDKSDKDVSGSPGSPASLGKSGAMRKVHPSRKQKHLRDIVQENSESTSYASERSNADEISKGNTSGSDDKQSAIGSHSNQLSVESRKHPETHDADIQGSEHNSSSSTAEEIVESIVEETSGEESTPGSSSQQLDSQSDNRNSKKHHPDTRNSEFHPHSHNSHQNVVKTMPRYEQQTEGDRVDKSKDHRPGGKGHSGPSHAITPSNKVQNETGSPCNEDESSYALVSDSQLTRVNSSQLTSLFSSDPNKPSDESEILEVQRNFKQSLRWSSSTSASMSVGISGSSGVAAISSPSGLSPTETTSKSQQQQSCSSRGPASQHSSCENGTDVDKVLGDEQERVTDTLKAKGGKDKANKDKRGKQHEEEKKTSTSSSKITPVPDNLQLTEDNIPSITKLDNAPASKKPKQHQEKDKDTTKLKRIDKHTSKKEDNLNHSNEQNATCPQPSKEASNTYYKSKKEKSHHKSKMAKASQNKAAQEKFENVSAQLENIHQEEVPKRDTDKYKTGNKTKDGDSKKKSSKETYFDQGDTVMKIGQLSSGILSSLKNELSEEEKNEMKHKAIQSWIITTTQSLGEIYHGDSSTGATIVSSNENGTTLGQIEDKQSERSSHEMDEDLEAQRKMISSIEKLEEFNMVSKIGSTVDTAAALQSQLVSRASQTTKVSDPQQTDLKTIQPCSAYQVATATILPPPSFLNSSVTECNEICCRTRRKPARAIQVDDHIDNVPGTSMGVLLPNVSTDNNGQKDTTQNGEVKIMSAQDVPSLIYTPKIPMDSDPSATSYPKQKSYLSYSCYQQPLLGVQVPSHYSTLSKMDNTISQPKATSFTPPFNFEETIPKKLPYHGEFGLNGDHQHDMRIWQQFCNQVNTDIDNSSKVCYKSPNLQVHHKKSTVKEILAMMETETDDDGMDVHLMDEFNRKRIDILRGKYFDEMDKESKRVHDLEDKIYALENKLTDQRVKKDIDLMRMQRETEVKLKNLQVQLNKKQHECIMIEVSSKAAAERDAKSMQDTTIKLKEMEIKMKLQEERISQINDEYDQLKKTNWAQREEINSLKKEKSLLETSTASLKENLEEAKTEISTKEGEVRDWKEKFNAMAEALSKFKKGTKNLNMMLQNRNEQVTEMTKKNEKNTKKVTQLEAQLQAIAKERSQEEEHRKYLQNNLDDARAERKRLREEATKDEQITAKVISEFKKKLEEVEKQKKDLETNLTLKTESLKEKARNEIDLQGEKALLEKEVTSLKEKLAEKDRLTRSEKRTLTVAKKTENELREKVDRYLTWIRESRRTIGNLCDSKDLLMRKVASLEFQISCDNNTREAEHDILRRELENAKSKISKLEKQLETKTTELSSVQLDLREAQLQIKQKELSEQSKETRISLLEQDITKLKEEKNAETNDKLAALMTLHKERQCHQCCVRQMQNNIWALEQSAMENAERCKALEAEKQTIMTNQRQEQQLEAPNKDGTSTSRDKPNTDTEPASTQEQQDKYQLLYHLLAVTILCQSAYLAPFKNVFGREMYLLMEEMLNKEIKILKDYLKTKIESLYSVEQLAERQATIIEKLELKLRNMKQQNQPTSTQESRKESNLTTKEVTISEWWSRFYKKKWQDNRKALIEEFTSERESMKHEIQDLNQQINQLQSQKNKDSRGHASIVQQQQQHMGQTSNHLEYQITAEKDSTHQSNHEHPGATKTTSTAEKQQKTHKQRQDPPCPCCSDTEGSSDDEEHIEA